MRWSCFVAALIAFGFPATSARAQGVKEALQIIPEDALGFVLVNRIEQTNDKIAGLTKRLGTPLPGGTLLALIKTKLGVQKGLNEKGSAAIALFPPSDEDPEIAVIFLPVTDYKEFLEPFRPKDASGAITEITVAEITMLAAKKGAFALVGQRHQRSVLEKALKAKKNVAAWAAPLTAWLNHNDVAGVMTPKGLKTVTALMRQGLERAKEGFAEAPPEAQFMVKWIDKLGGFVKSIETDVTHVGLGGRIDPAGNLHVNARALFAKDSGFAKGAAGFKPLPGGPLVGLPAGPYAVALGGMLPENAMLAMMNLNLEMIKTLGNAKDLPAEKLKKLEQAYAQMAKGVNGMGMVMHVGKPDEPLFASMVAVMHTDNAPEYLARYAKGMKGMNEVLKDLKIPFMPSSEFKRVKVNGVTALEITTDLTAGIPNPDELKALYEKMFGPGGKMTMAMAPLNDTAVIMRYTPASGLKNLLGAKGPGLAADPDIVKTASLLPKGAQWAFYVNPKGMRDLVHGAIKAFSPMPIEVPAFAKTPPVGFAVKLAETGLEFHAVLPAAVQEELGAFIPKVKKLKVDD